MSGEGSGTADMTAQEQELLQYLEDLQANNPAEYEMLVKELQEKEAAKGGGKGGGQQGEQVTPTPGFVAKTRSATRQGAKVFINVCSSEHVDAPAPVESGEDASSEEVQMRIPLSLGPPREDLDKNGDVCTVYDVVFHPDAVEGALKEAEFRSFVMQLTVHQIEQKYKDEVSLEMSYPKLKGNYKGIAPLPQFMRKKGVPPPPPPGSAPAVDDASTAQQGGGGGAKPLVEEMAAPSAESLPAPSYAVEPRRVGAGSGDPDALSIKVHLPHVDDASAIELRMSSESLELLVPSMCALSIQLPRVVRVPPAAASFEAERKILSLLLKADVAATIDDGVGESAQTPSAGEGEVDAETSRREREREARLNAKRRRAAGNQQLQRQAGAEAAAEAAAQAVEEAGGEAAAEEATGGEQGDAEADGGGEAASKAEIKVVAKAKDSGLIELTNSIMFELEM